MEFPEHLRYTKEHEWAEEIAPGRVRVGITDFAQDALGDIVYVDLPAVGTAVTKDQPFASVDSTKSASDVYAPVSGTIVERNPALEDHPELANGAPYGEGWFVVLEVAPGTDLTALMDAAAYRALTGA